MKNIKDDDLTTQAIMFGRAQLLFSIHFILEILLLLNIRGLYIGSVTKYEAAILSIIISYVILIYYFMIEIDMNNYKDDEYSELNIKITYVVMICKLILSMYCIVKII